MFKAPPTYNFGIETSKCGEIFSTNFIEFTFCCTFCQVGTFSFEDFVYHVKYLHFSKESGKSNAEEKEINHYDGSPTNIGKMKDDENYTCDSIDQSHNDNPDNQHVENELEYGKDLIDKALCNFEAEHQELVYFDGFSNIKFKLKDQEKNTHDNTEQACNGNSDNGYDENDLEPDKNFSDKDLCHDGKINESNCSESDSIADMEVIKFGSDEFPDSEYICQTNEITANAVEYLEPKHGSISDENTSKVLKSMEESFNESLRKSEILQHRCPECYEPFFKKKEMFTHVLKVHNGFKCPECNKHFKYSSRLAKHIKIHSTVTIFICPIENCSKSFNAEVKLKRHSVVHNAERNFVCEYENCRKTFQSKRQLNSHKYGHNAVRKNVCDLCNFACRCKQRLAAHRRTHTGEKPFPCEVCNKKFISKEAVKIHMITHAETRPHICPTCNKGFAHQRMLARHVDIHSNESRFKCKLCEKSFKRPRSLAVHLRNTHTQKSKA